MRLISWSLLSHLFHGRKMDETLGTLLLSRLWNDTGYASEVFSIVAEGLRGIVQTKNC